MSNDKGEGFIIRESKKASRGLYLNQKDIDRKKKKKREITFLLDFQKRRFSIIRVGQSVRPSVRNG